MTTEIKTLVKEKIKIEEPSMYDVIFLNDNITTTKNTYLIIQLYALYK